MAPLIWSLLINLSRSVAEVSEDTDVAYLHVYMYSYAPSQKRKLDY
jgi:hypothetical protein